MNLSQRLRASRLAAPQGVTDRRSGGLDRKTFDAVKSMVHFRLVEELDMATVASMPREELSRTVRQTLQQITAAEKMPLNQRERSLLVADLMNEILGFGPIEPLVQDENVQDILVNGCNRIWIESAGVLQPTAIQFRDNAHLMQVIDKIVSAVGRRIDESSPMVDARLPDGSRVNVIVPPLSLDGPILSIRKFGRSALTIQDLLAGRSLTPEIAAFLEGAVRAKLNILISGGTGAGKTTLLNALSAWIPRGERIVTIEDSAELRLHQPHVVRLESRPPNIEGRGEVTLADLMKNSLRMRPDRIIVGEARGAEVVDMLQAMNTGHPGSMSTIHTNSPRDALSRMEIMLGMGPMQFSERAMRGLIASAIHLIVQVARLTDGSRRLVSVTEIDGRQDDRIRLAEIFRFEQQGIDAAGKIHGRFAATGTTSRFEAHMAARGVRLAPELFTFSREVA